MDRRLSSIQMHGACIDLHALPVPTDADGSVAQSINHACVVVSVGIHPCIIYYICYSLNLASKCCKKKAKKKGKKICMQCNAMLLSCGMHMHMMDWWYENDDALPCMFQFAWTWWTTSMFQPQGLSWENRQGNQGDKDGEKGRCPSPHAWGVKSDHLDSGTQGLILLFMHLSWQKALPIILLYVYCLCLNSRAKLGQDRLKNMTIEYGGRFLKLHVLIILCYGPL